MDIDVYCDESRPDLFASSDERTPFLVIGGLWCERSSREEFKYELHALRDRHRYGGEFKWQKASQSRVAFYLDLVSWFFSKGDAIRFRSIVVDKRKVDLARYHGDDQELGFYKFYYQLLVHWLHDGNRYQIFLDFKSNRRRDRLQDLERCLTHARPAAAIRAVQATRSEESVLIQAADVFTGLISSSLNGSVESSSAKSKLIRAVESHIGGGIKATSPWETKFNIFVIQPRGAW